MQWEMNKTKNPNTGQLYNYKEKKYDYNASKCNVIHNDDLLELMYNLG